MNKIELMNTVTRSFHKIGFQFKKHSPEILVVTGVVGVVTSTVMACKATTKLDGILSETKERAQRHREAVENPEAFGLTPEEYTSEDGKRDLTIVYAKTGLELVKLYAPAVIIGAASIACILTSHKILRTRNVALAAAYATVDRGFKQYRGRVIERFGEELDRELKYDLKAKEVEETVINEDGTESTVKKTVSGIYTDDPNNYSMFARCFAEGTPGWDRNPEFSLMYLRRQQNWATDRLRSRGYLLLNEVYETLGFPVIQAGSQVGWVYDPNDETLDNYVDFGIYNADSQRAIAFVNGDERNIWLDFNVDGNVWKLMK